MNKQPFCHIPSNFINFLPMYLLKVITEAQCKVDPNYHPESLVTLESDIVTDVHDVTGLIHGHCCRG
jgi:hypothetical protein